MMSSAISDASWTITVAKLANVLIPVNTSLAENTKLASREFVVRKNLNDNFLTDKSK